MWSGTTVPTGWALCNGSNGTPDLRDRFIVGAGSSYAVGATGGTATDNHTHTISCTTGGYSGSRLGEDLIKNRSFVRTHTHTINLTSSQAGVDNRPPYYALSYIMKLPYSSLQAGTHYNEGNLNASSGLLPSGAIMIWSGSASSIPSGWYLCNGSNGTPNLQDRFIVGAGGGYSIGATGGSATKNHSHTYSGNTNTVSNNWSAWAGDNATANTHYHAVSGTTDSTSITNLPPYYALCYIMKG